MEHSLRVRHTCWALAILTIATLCCFHKLALNPGSVLVGPQNRGANDLTSQYIANREYAARTVHEFGELPLWNPHICLGLPFAGNPQAGLYYPPNWLCHVGPAGLVLSWLLVAHLLFAGVGTYVLARRYGIGWGGGVTGGIIFLAAPFLVAQSAEGHYGQICAISWIPWAFLAFESVREGRRQAAVLLALCLAMSFFCGHVQETYYLVLILSAIVLWDLLSRTWSGSGGAGRQLGAWIRVGLCTVGVVAIDLIPVYVASRMSLRTSSSAANFGWESFRLESLLELLQPFALTRPEFWEAGTTPFWEKLCHFGIIPLVLAVSAVILAWSRKPTRRMALLWIFTLLFAFGTNTPLFTSLVEFVPGLSWFRHPSRILFFTSFATSMLAAVAVDELVKRTQTGRKSLLVFAGVTGFVAIGLLAAWNRLADVVGGGELTLADPSLVCVWLSVPGVLALLTLTRPGLFRPILLPTILVACVVELTLFADQVTDTATMSSLKERDESLFNRLQEAAVDSGRVLAFQDIVSDGEAYRYGLRKVRGYDPVGPATYLMLLENLAIPDRDVPEPMGFMPVHTGDLRKNLLDLLSVRHAVQVRDPERAISPGWSLVDVRMIRERITIDGATLPPLGYNCEILRNDTPLPRAYVVGDVRELSTWDEFNLVLDDIDFHKEVVLQRDVLPDGPRSGYRPAEIVNASSNHLEVVARLDAPGYLVVSDPLFPGWHVTVNGQRAVPLNANMMFRAVPLPAGHHEVMFSFRPPGLLLGSAISGGFLLVLIGSLVVGRTEADSREDRHQPATHSDRKEAAVGAV